jgi:hypothetical protein
MSTTQTLHDTISEMTQFNTLDLGFIPQQSQRLVDAISVYETQLHAVRSDKRLSAEGKAEKLDEAKAYLETVQDEVLGYVKPRLDKYLSDAKAELISQSEAVTDPVLREARLQGAKQDARMLLDGLPENELISRVSEWLEAGQLPDGVRDLITSDWMKTYLLSRGGTEAVRNWERHGGIIELLALPPDQRPKLERLKKLSQVPQLLQGMMYYAMKDIK